MKHLLALLTVVLAGAAMTASAGTTYTEATFLADNYTEKFDKLLDTTSTANDRNGSYNFGSYVVTFEGWSKLKIHANENINLYVYDVVDNVGSGNNVSALKGTAPNPVQQIGYRELGTDNATIHALGNPTDSEVLQRYYQGENPQPYEVVRNSYYLGEFEAGKDYELYVSYNADGSGGRWSYADGAGGYNAQTDAMMSVYLSKNFDNTYNVQAGQYAALAQVNNKSFGLRAAPAAGGGTFGSPLTGGLKIAIIAGLFGLGFWYVRRRKAIAA